MRIPLPQVYTSYDDAPPLTQEGLQAAVDFLRQLAIARDLPQQASIPLEKAIVSLQKLCDSLCPLALLKTVCDLRGWHTLPPRATDVSPGLRRITFRAAFLVKVLCLGDLLRSSASLPKVIIAVLNMVLPEVLRPLCIEMVEAARTAVPHKGTVSRWRFILDAAYMNIQRQDFRAMLQNGGIVTYMLRIHQCSMAETSSM